MSKFIPTSVRLITKLLSRRVHRGLPPVLSFANTADTFVTPGESEAEMRQRVWSELTEAGYLVAFGRHATVVSADSDFAPAT